MNITLINEWGGAEIGASLIMDESIGNDLINRGIAKEVSIKKTTKEKTEVVENLSAQEGAAKSGGKDDE